MIGIIVQARMASTRLPGKMLLEINGKPLIDYVFSQLEHVQKQNIVILATTKNPVDDTLAAYAKVKGITCFRGSENNVLERFYQAATQQNLQHVIRITGDCPFIDPEVCNRIIDFYFREQVDLAGTGDSFADGVDFEILSFKTLDKIYCNAKLQSEKEHVTLYAYNNPEEFKIAILENETNDSQYRFTLDEPDDLKVIEQIIKAFSKNGVIKFTTKEIKNFLDQHPEVFQLNTHIIRNDGLLKSLRND